MDLFWKLLAALNLCSIALTAPRSRPEPSDEFFDTTPGATVTIHCPTPINSPCFMYATEETKGIPVLDETNLISNTGFLVLRDVTEADSKMFVCYYPHERTKPLRIHLRVMEESKHPNPELIDKPRARYPLVQLAAARKRQTPRRRKPYQKDDWGEETTEGTTTEMTTARVTDVNPDEPPGAMPEEIADYEKRAQLRKSLFPPSKPELLKVNETTIQVKWTINLMKKYPVAYFMIQFLDKVGENVLGGASEIHDAEKTAPSILYWHNFDGLKKGHSYQFRVAAVYNAKDDISVLSKKSDWISI